jgi:phosphohistidine phosphatase
VRHGQAKPTDASQSDFDRPLDRRGEAELAEIASRLAQTGGGPPCILASPAQRTRQSAVILARALGLAERRILYEERLYLAPSSELLCALQGLGPHIQHALLVGHNPGVSDLARLLVSPARPGELGTGEALCLALPEAPWEALGGAVASELAHEVPRRRFQIFS